MNKIFNHIIPLLVALVIVPHSASAWGKKGHDVVAFIAECHLTESAFKSVERVLGGKSMVYYSSWMDGASHTKEYDYTRTWHYYNIERGESVATAKRNRKGDLITATESIVQELKAGEMSSEEEFVALKMLIHLIGDMHQPMHLGRKEDEGGGDRPVIYFVESTSLHAIWDYHLVEGIHSWSYTEWQREIDRLSDDEVRRITEGTYAEWMEETHKITKEIYRDTPIEKRVYYEYLDKYTPTIEQQLLFAGVRLADILNGIY